MRFHELRRRLPWVGTCVMALLYQACGGGGKGEGAPPPPPVAPTGVVHEVRMDRTPDGHFAFDPAELTIQRGDSVRWVVAGGVPHNVSFYPESLPPGAAPLLEAALPPEGKISPLGGRVLTQPGDTFAMAFTTVPPGRYRYFCVPHEVLGMRGTLTVRP